MCCQSLVTIPWFCWPSLFTLHFTSTSVSLHFTALNLFTSLESWQMSWPGPWWFMIWYDSVTFGNFWRTIIQQLGNHGVVGRMRMRMRIMMAWSLMDSPCVVASEKEKTCELWLGPDRIRDLGWFCWHVLSYMQCFWFCRLNFDIFFTLLGPRFKDYLNYWLKFPKIVNIIICNNIDTIMTIYNICPMSASCCK